MSDAFCFVDKYDMMFGNDKADGDHSGSID